MIIENDVAKSKKSFNQENQGADSGGLGGAKQANIIAQRRPSPCFAKFEPLSQEQSI